MGFKGHNAEVIFFFNNHKLREKDSAVNACMIKFTLINVWRAVEGAKIADEACWFGLLAEKSYFCA